MEYKINSKTLGNIGTILNNIRIDHGVAQAAIASELGVNQPQISKLESNRVEPSLSSLVKYLEACNCELIIQPK